MELPGYARLVWLARVTGRVSALITIGHSGGTPASVDLHSEQPLLVSFLKARLASAKFLSSCADQTIEIRFIYVLAGDPEEEPHSEFKLRAPDTIEVRARPPVPRIRP
jgi:hypothetical protein